MQVTPLRCAHCAPRSRRRSRGFTLVELLVVIAIIGVLVALLLPAIQAAREAARRSQCLSNLRQVSLGLLNYESARKSFPSAFDFPAGTNPATSPNIGPNWIIRVLPYMEQQTVYDRFDLTKYISDTANEPARTTVIDALRCPSDSFAYQHMEVQGPRTPVYWARGNYAANAGNGPLLTTSTGATIGIFGPDSPGWKDDKRRGVIGPNVAVNLRQITDGGSSTILVAEVRSGVTPRDRRGTWAMGQAGSSVLFWFGSTGDANGPNVCNANADDVAGPTSTDLTILEQECMPDYTGDDWADQATTRSAHPGGVNLGMADGSSHFVSNEVETSGPYGAWGTVWDKMIASADGQVIGDMPF